MSENLEGRKVTCRKTYKAEKLTCRKTYKAEKLHVGKLTSVET